MIQNKNNTENFFKRSINSITKFEKYSDYAIENKKKSIIYLIIWIFIFAVVVSVIATIEIRQSVNEIANKIKDSDAIITYKDDTLSVINSNGEGYKINKTNEMLNNIIIDTETENEEEIEKYEKQISENGGGVILLKNKIIIENTIISDKRELKYNEALETITGKEIKEFSKENMVDYLTGTIIKQYIINLFITILIFEFIIYGIKTIINVFTISILGHITCTISRTKIKYSALIKMSIYSLTLPIILEIIYYIINTFTGYTITYFDVAYMGIAYIYITAAIFIIKSDFIKKQKEMIKIIKKETLEEEKQETKEEKDNDNDDTGESET